MSDEKEKVDKDTLEEEIIEYDIDEENEKPKKEEQKGFFAKFRKFKKSKVGGVIWQVFTSLLMLAIAAGIGIFLAIGKVKGGPTVFAEEYFRYYAANNWYQMFNSTEISESRFINQTTFSRYMSQIEIPEEVKSFEVVDVEKDGEYATVKVDYKTVDGKERTSTMRLKKQDKNVLLFYSTWKGDAESFIINDCEIRIPDGFVLKFDGEEIEDVKQPAVEGMCTYVFDRMFKGRHTVEISGTGVDTKTVELDWNTDNAAYQITLEELGISEAIKSEISKKSKELLVAYYQAALTKAGADGIKALVTGDETVAAGLDEQYKALLAAINKEDGSMMSSLEISACECAIDQYSYMDSATVTLNYTANYTAKKPRSLVHGVRKTYNGSNTASMTVNFKCVEGVWTISNSNMVCVDYSVETPTE